MIVCFNLIIMTSYYRGSLQSCDMCRRGIYGRGFRVIRSVRNELLGIKNIPFLFNVCSFKCQTQLEKKDSTEWKNVFSLVHVHT